MITLKLGSCQYQCSILQVLQNGRLFDSFKWGHRECLSGYISMETDLILTSINTNFIYIEKMTVSILSEIAGKGDIEAVFTKSRLPISTSSKMKLPYIFTLPMDVEIPEGGIVVVEIDLIGYSVYDSNAMHLLYWQELNLTQLHSRLVDDFNAVETYLGLKPTNQINVIFAKDLNDLFNFTGQSSTFAYQDRIMGLIYKSGKYRPDFHEYTHILLYRLGAPPFIFLEGMATMASDLLFAKDNNRKSFDLLASMFLKKYSTYSLEDLFTVNYSSENYHIHMYYISASFVYYLTRNFGMDQVKTCYKNISRLDDRFRNLEMFRSIIGKPLEEVQKEWLSALGKQ